MLKELEKTVDNYLAKVDVCMSVADATTTMEV